MKIERKNKNLIILSLLLIGVIFLAGCTSTPYQQPEKVTGEAVKPTASTVKTFKIGETASDGKLSITVTSVRYATMIDEQDNEFLIAEAKTGMKFAILDITITNLQTDMTQLLSTMIQMKTKDKEGYAYNLDFIGAMALAKYCKACDGQLLPDSKARGEISFEVPDNVQGLQFHFLFELVGTTAVFDLM